MVIILSTYYISEVINNSTICKTDVLNLQIFASFLPKYIALLFKQFLVLPCMGWMSII